MDSRQHEALYVEKFGKQDQVPILASTPI